MFTREELDEMEAVLIGCIKMLTRERDMFLANSLHLKAQEADRMIESQKKLLNRVVDVKYEKCP